MMVSHLLGTEDLDKDLEEFILEKTEGVPFFIEELIKSLNDLKIIEKKNNRYHITKDIQEVTIPATIQDGVGNVRAKVECRAHIACIKGFAKIIV